MRSKGNVLCFANIQEVPLLCRSFFYQNFDLYIDPGAMSIDSTNILLCTHHLRLFNAEFKKLQTFWWNTIAWKCHIDSVGARKANASIIVCIETDSRLYNAPHIGESIVHRFRSAWIAAAPLLNYVDQWWTHANICARI